MDHRTLSILLLTAALTGCAVGPFGTPLLSLRSSADDVESEYRLTKNVETPDLMRSVLLRQIPVGSTREHAQRQLEIEGFTCKFRRKADFSDQFDKYENVDYVHGDRNDSQGMFTSKRWQVAVILDQGRVSKIAVKESSSGL